MPTYKPKVLTFTTFKHQSFPVKFPKHLRELKLNQNKSPIIRHYEARKLKHCKILRSLETAFPNDICKKPLYSYICRLHQKTMRYLNTNGHNYYHIIRNPRRYELQLGNRRSWKIFFEKRSVRFLKMYSNPYDTMLSGEQIAWVLFRLKYCFKEIGYIREIEIAGHILNYKAEILIDNLARAIGEHRSKISIELKAWDHNSEEMSWFDTPIIQEQTNSVYFVNRCHDFRNLIEPIGSLSSFNSLQKLELWVRLHQKNDFSALRQFELCKSLKELRLRFDFDGDLAKISKKFLNDLKLPDKLTYLNLSISGLRLDWIHDKLPSSKDMEKDSSTLAFFQEFEKLEQLEAFHFALQDLRINFSSIFINVIRRLKNLTGLSLIMGVNKQFDFKMAPDYLILEFGFWCRRLASIFSQLKTLSMEFPCLYIDDVEPTAGLLQNAEIISLGYRILSKTKHSSKVDTFLGMLNPNKITALFLGDMEVDNEESFKKKFENLAKLKSLQNLTVAIKFISISSQLLAYFCECLSRMNQLRRFSCRFEQGNIADSQWRLKLKKIFVGMKSLNWAKIISKHGIIEFER